MERERRFCESVTHAFLINARQNDMSMTGAGVRALDSVLEMKNLMICM